MKVNLCLIMDDNYSMAAGVALYSILRNKAPSTAYDVYVICDKVTTQHKDALAQLSTKDFQVKCIDIGNAYDFSNYQIDEIPASPAAIYKFLIPQILGHLDRALYLDGDIIVKGDLADLYNAKLDGNYIGAVKDTCGLDYARFIDGKFSYFNSGVMIMDLAKMRDDHIPEKLLEYRKSGYNKLMDQDALNYVLRDNVKLVSFRYNTQLSALSAAVQSSRGYTVTRFQKYWGFDKKLDSLEKICDAAMILHYTTAKPWKYYDGYGNDLWLEYYLASPFNNGSLLRSSFYIQKITNSFKFKLASKLTFIYAIRSHFKNQTRHKFLRYFVKQGGKNEKTRA